MKVNFDLSKKDKVIVAVSGGVDSMCLLDLVVKQSGLPLEHIVAAHLDHGLRDDTDLDKRLVMEKCKEYGVYCVFDSVSLSAKEGNVEARARDRRYDFLESVRETEGADWILTGHHRDDQAETVLMKFLKGTFIKGLRGMLVKNEESKIYRPLLSFSKSDLLQYAEENEIEYREDSTNTDIRYDRNFMRHHVMPVINERYEGFVDRLANNSKYFAELDQYLKSRVFEWINEDFCDDELGRTFEISRYFAEPTFFRFLILTMMLDMDLSQNDLVEIDRIICESQAGSQRKVGDYHLYIGSDTVLISELEIDEISGVVFKRFLQEVDPELVSKKGCSVRIYEEGDRCKFLSMEKPKKLKEFFVKHKIPWYYRAGLPLIVDQENLVVSVIPYKNELAN